MESELDEHRSQVEKRVLERTAGLIKANNRLQLEALERDLAEERTQRKYRLLEAINEAWWDYSPSRGEINYSPGWFTMLGYEAGAFPETLGTWSRLCHPDDLSVLENSLHSLDSVKDQAFGIEIRMRSRTGQWRWLQVRGRTVEKDDEGRAFRIVGTLIDISKYKQVEVALQKANDELQRLAAMDALTQIANRRRFEDRLAREWRRGRRENRMLAVILCDIDYFKDYNDSYGHLKGDEALYAVAQAISAVLRRPMDLAARYGGEEFAMILPNTGVGGARRVAREVKKAVAALSIEHQSSKVNANITLSFGVAAVTPTQALSSKILVETADRALYRAKSKGRNQIFCIPGRKGAVHASASNDRV
jgi:diguanylate cyclase (GGDEF)-like protein/PAS domain S-box-containing protein